MTGRRPSCRLYVILAREAPVGVIFRRGPSKWVQLLKWSTRDDALEPGQWFRGRVYEGRSDLSPDGSRLLYFASRGAPRPGDDEGATHAWTAVSKPPYLTALALWPKGDAWHGGGLFDADRAVWLNHKPEEAEPHPDHLPDGLKVRSNPEAHGEDAPVLWRRLVRDGWICTQDGVYRPGRHGWTTDRPEVWTKADPAGERVLVMRQVGIDLERPGGPRVLEFSLLDRARAIETPLQADCWADFDHRGRLVFVRRGCLMTAALDDTNRLCSEEIADLTDAEPREVEAPAWARRA